MTNNPTKAPKIKQLYRSATDRIIAGVCGGLGEYFHADSTLFRTLFAALAVLGGSGFILYIALWIVIPARSSAT